VVVLERMLARSTSKSAVSRAFVAHTSERHRELMARRLDDVRLAVADARRHRPQRRYVVALLRPAPRADPSVPARPQILYW
jgi:hypothetical protein